MLRQRRRGSNTERKSKSGGGRQGQRRMCQGLRGVNKFPLPTKGRRGPLHRWRRAWGHYGKQLATLRPRWPALQKHHEIVPKFIVQKDRKQGMRSFAREHDSAQFYRFFWNGVSKILWDSQIHVRTSLLAG